jgi:ABC-2 type transport system ATP-binding protein
MSVGADAGMDVGVEVDGLRKRFGRRAALDGVTFGVRPGEVTGFVGPNGAGKSTTMRVLLGLDRADEGTALIGGLPYARLRRPLRSVGALLDAAAVQPGRTGRDHLLWLARSQGLGTRRVRDVVESVGLGEAAGRRAGGYSLGMRQRLGIAAAMLGDPGVVVMDEPFNGMDPEGIVWLKGFLGRLAGEGRAVLISSHLMGELQDTARHVVVVGRGKVVADTTVEELIASASEGHVTLRTTAPDAAAAVLRDAGATVVPGAPGTLIITGTVAGIGGITGPAAGPERVVTLLTARAVPFSEVSAHRATLEQAYLRLTRGATEFRGTDR